MKPTKRPARRRLPPKPAPATLLRSLLQDEFRKHLEDERSDREKLLALHAKAFTDGLKVSFDEMKERFDRMALVFDGMASAYERERAAAEKLLRKIEDVERRLAELEDWRDQVIERSPGFGPRKVGK